MVLSLRFFSYLIFWLFFNGFFYPLYPLLIRHGFPLIPHLGLKLCPVSLRGKMKQSKDWLYPRNLYRVCITAYTCTTYALHYFLSDMAFHSSLIWDSSCALLACMEKIEKRKITTKLKDVPLFSSQTCTLAQLTAVIMYLPFEGHYEYP